MNYPLCVLRNGDSHSRIILWWWQFSTDHSTSKDNPIEVYQAYITMWINAIDCADIYSGVEESIWSLSEYVHMQKFRIHTKHVPDLEKIRNWNITRDSTRSLIFRSLERTKKEFLDLVQFHQWIYENNSYKVSIESLIELQNEGYIWGIWVTNCSIKFLEKLKQECSFVPLTTQNQYNIIDRRPEKWLLDYCDRNIVAFYAYGTLMGGLISERYLWVNEPIEPLENRSIRKYLRIINDWGDWELFQRLLKELQRIANKYDVTLSDIAVAWTLWRLSRGAVIIGARNKNHVLSIHRLQSTILESDDFKAIDTIYSQWIPIEWDCFDLERYESRHRDIMKFDLNKK